VRGAGALSARAARCAPPAQQRPQLRSSGTQLAVQCGV